MNLEKETKLWETLTSTSKNFEMSIDDLLRKRTGSYYTDLSLTDVMMKELVENLKKKNKPLINYRFLEPCVGSGNFVFSYIKAIHQTGISNDDAVVLLNNIYVADVNEEALNEYKKSLNAVVFHYWGINLSNDYFSSHVRTGLLIDVTKQELHYISIQDVFPQEVIQNGFDIVVTNPPYKNLKAEKNQYHDEKEYFEDKAKYSCVSKIASDKFKYSTSGVLNLYKLFVEEIIDRYTNNQAFIYLLIPSSILSDQTCMKLRTHILEDSKLISVKIIKEGSQYIDAKQSLSAILIEKGEKTNWINITKDYCSSPTSNEKISIIDVMNKNTGNSIFAVSNDEYKILKKLQSFPVIKDLDFLVNLRGELDLTTHKHSITKEPTNYPLLRGRNIKYFDIQNTEVDYVESDFVLACKKNQYITKDRIACQQIANMKKDRRVTFAYIPKNHVLGNSCNFISVKENLYGIDIYSVLGLLNSSIINWYFKLTSSNNHINNYEIDSFPIPVDSSELTLISKLVQKYLQHQRSDILQEIEELTIKAYGLSNTIKSQNNRTINDSIKHSNTLTNTNNIIKTTNDLYKLNYTKDINLIIPTIQPNEAVDILNGKLSINDFLTDLDSFNKNVALGITTKYKSLYNGNILNHKTFKLSDLDLEMIKSVPQGGSWKDIPMETVLKSKRLKKITETGGRTTLYGRIDYEKPSYTITTYFNRPGNGTYVHPIHDRVLSIREAARFQSFKDDYYFFGNQGHVLKQIGNAVPTILAFQIAKKIRDVTNCITSIDLFCGAGGLTAGFKAAGIKSLISTDIEESACTTLKINNPEINVLCGDITDSNTKNLIERTVDNQEVDIICGGPPCQGFSLAGFRSEDDPRNQLFRDFVEIVKRISPKIIVFENVEGLLSYQKGKTYNEVHALFTELGYQTEGRTLLANEYGVPQKRKRVFIICTRRDLELNPAQLFPDKTTPNPENQITAKETISDLENIECNDSATYIDVNNPSKILKFFKGELTYSEYINEISTFERNSSQ